MNIIEWVVWGLACAFGLWGFVTFLVEVFNIDQFPTGPEACYPPVLRQILSGLYTLGMGVSVVVTGFGFISKLHLLWFIPIWFFLGTQWIGGLYIWLSTRSLRRYYKGTGQLAALFLAQQNSQNVTSPSGNPEGSHRSSSIEQIPTEDSEVVVLDHPFWDDYLEAFRLASIKEVDYETAEKIRQLNCTLFPPSLLRIRWPGWELGIPRPPGSVPKEVLTLWNVDITFFLQQFFRRVERGELYCDYTCVIERFGEDLVEKRIGSKTGLLLNLEAVYWTFNVNFNKWIRQNKKVYDCSLVCDLDEILARVDSQLKSAFFPTPGPFDIGWRKRKKWQRQMLSVFAPDLEERLMKQIWN